MVVASGSMRIEMQNLIKGPKCRYEVKVTINLSCVVFVDGGETWGEQGFVIGWMRRACAVSVGSPFLLLRRYNARASTCIES